MSELTLPSIFLSHGAPTLAVSHSPARDFLAGYGRMLGRPRAIVVVSAHYEARGRVLATASEHPETVHDFGNFGPELFQLRYPAPGHPELAARIVDLCRGAGLPAEVDQRSGFDHGTWVPLILLYPQADIPVVQVSIDPVAGPGHHLSLGRALAPLRSEGVLVIGSGSATHNLQELFRGRMREDSVAPDWVRGFGEWLGGAIEGGREDDLLHYAERGPDGRRNHPTEEHLLPLFAAMGAGRSGVRAGAGRRVHASHTYGVLAMDVYEWGGEETALAA